MIGLETINKNKIFGDQKKTNLVEKLLLVMEKMYFIHIVKMISLNIQN